MRELHLFWHWLFQRKVLILLLGGLFSSGMLLILLNEFEEEISEPWLRGSDQAAMRVLHSISNPQLTSITFGFTYVGSWQYMFPGLTLLVVILLFNKRAATAGVLTVTVGGSALLNIGLKVWFHRARPDVPWALAHETSFSFPSGHAVAAFCFYATAAFLLARGKRLGTRIALMIASILMIVGIGISRVYLGVHYPTDIAAGYLVGFIWSGTVLTAAYYLQRSTRL